MPKRLEESQQNQLTLAADAVKNGMTYRRAQELYGVSKSTIQRKFQAAFKPPLNKCQPVMTEVCNSMTEKDYFKAHKITCQRSKPPDPDEPDEVITEPLIEPPIIRTMRNPNHLQSMRNDVLGQSQATKTSETTGEAVTNKNTQAPRTSPIQKLLEQTKILNEARPKTVQTQGFNPLECGVCHVTYFGLQSFNVHRTHCTLQASSQSNLPPNKNKGILKCAVAACENNKHSMVRFFSFPSDETRQALWALKCYRREKIDYSSEVICSKHFPLSDYEDASEAQCLPERLKRTAVPSHSLHTAEIEEQLELLRCAADSKTLNITAASLPVGNLFVKLVKNVQFIGLIEKIDQLQNEINTLRTENDSLTRSNKYLQQKCQATETSHESGVMKSSLDEIKELLKDYLTPSQIAIMLQHRVTGKWGEVDFERAHAIKSISRKCYFYLRNNLNYPLPCPSALNYWEKEKEMQRNENAMDTLAIPDHDYTHKFKPKRLITKKSKHFPATNNKKATKKKKRVFRKTLKLNSDKHHRHRKHKTYSKSQTETIGEPECLESNGFQCNDKENEEVQKTLENGSSVGRVDQQETINTEQIESEYEVSVDKDEQQMEVEDGLLKKNNVSNVLESVGNDDSSIIIIVKK